MDQLKDDEVDAGEFLSQWTISSVNPQAVGLVLIRYVLFAESSLKSLSRGSSMFTG